MTETTGVPPKVGRDMLKMLDAAVSAVAGDAAVSRWLRANPLAEDCAVVAVGKAAAPMWRGALAVLGSRILDALVISAHDYLDLPPEDAEWVEGAHPVPDRRSLAAGEKLLTFIGRQPVGRRLLFLISGGSSSMVEVLQPGLDETVLDRVSRWLLGSGLAIDQMNAVRKALSRIKGGGLLDFVAGRPVTALLISDVPGDDPAVIGSGLLTPDPSVPDVLGRLALPEWLRELVDAGWRERPAVSVRQVVVAGNREARDAAAAQARRSGYSAVVHKELLRGDAASAGERLARELLAAPPGIHLWGGETTVRLPEDPGRGGRNQHLALAAARVLDGCNGVALLSAGTDGRDGPGEDAGALVDGGTLARGRLEGFDADFSLRTANSGGFLEAAGDLVHTGPTGTNVMDLVIGWRSS